MTSDTAPSIDRLTQTRSEIALWLEQDAAVRAQAIADLGITDPSRAVGHTANRLAGVALGAVADGLKHRAAQSPAMSLAHAAGDAGQALLLPTARSHPWALVGSAAVAGALLALGARSALRPAGWGRWMAQWAAPSLARAAMQALRPTHPPTRRHARPDLD